MISCISAEPIINSVSPEDEARLDYNPLLIIDVSNDFPMDIIWYFKEAESEYWEKIGTNLSVTSGIYQQFIPNGTMESTNYQWKVNIFDENSSIEEIFNFRRRGWQVVSGGSWWITGGNVSGTFYNRSITPIFPPPESKEILILNKNDLSKCEHRLVFSLDFVTIPVIGKEFEFGEYYLKGEKIIAVRFLIEDSLSDYSNFSEVVLTILSQEENVIKSINLDLDKNITEFDSPFILDSSGLWKISIEFTLNDKENDSFYVFENISKWNQYDDKDYLTFYLEKESDLNFQNYYEKCIPVLSTSELVELQQMLLAEKQGEYLQDTATSLNDTANSIENVTIQLSDYIRNAESLTWAAWVAAIAAISTVFLAFGLEFYRKNIRKKHLFGALFREIQDNLKVVNDYLEGCIKKSTFVEGRAFSMFHYEKNDELYKIKNKELLNRLSKAYYDIKRYNANYRWNKGRFKNLQKNLEYLKENLPKEFSFLK